MNYTDAVAQLLGLADFERKSRAGEPPDFHLRRMDVLLERLGHPERLTPTIHVAGSKGKGSTAAMVASSLQASGLRTGLFTSPHLHRMTERIRIDMREVAQDRFAALVEELWPHVEAVARRGDVGRVSVFELLTAMSFHEFRSVGADVQVVEVGLGGRLDATNLVTSDVSVITPISLDHTAVLGDTVPKIAYEKAGIIKPGVPVVVGRQAPAARRVLADVALRRGAETVNALERISLRRGPEGARRPRIELVSAGPDGTRYDIELALSGDHQVDNARTAIAALEAFSARRGIEISPDAVARGLSTVEWPARAEILTGPDEPVQVLVDGAHNSSSANALVATMRQLFPAARGVVLVYAGSGGHDFAATAREFASLKPRVVVTRTRHPKAVDPDAVAEALRCDNVMVAAVTTNVADALKRARALARPGEVIIGTGSLFVAAEVRERLLAMRPELYPDLRGGWMRSYEPDQSPVRPPVR